MNDIIYFDLETSGLDVGEDRIVEIYAKKIADNGDITELYHLIDPKIAIKKEASDVHGYMNIDLVGKPTFAELADEIFSFFDGCDLGGYNVMRFDIPMLTEELLRSGKRFNPLNPKIKIVDGFLIASKFESLKLSSLYERYFGESFEDAHSAKSDVDATIRVIDEQRKRYDLSDISDYMLTDFRGNKKLDLSGLLYEKNDEVYFGIGKHKDKLVVNHLDYLDWVIDMSSHTELTKIYSRILRKKLIKDRL